MNILIEKHKKEFDGAVEFFKKDIAMIKAGRASPALVENVAVDSYGVKTPLIELASLSAPDAKSILIQPWDKNILKDIEKAILEARLGFNPVNEGNSIRITLPHLTQEDRSQLVKLLHQKLENGKIKIRGARDRVREDILKSEKNKEITEDDKYDFLKELDEFAKDETGKIEDIAKKKEEEIMKI